jgi:hypothetical protein
MSLKPLECIDQSAKDFEKMEKMGGLDPAERHEVNRHG